MGDIIYNTRGCVFKKKEKQGGVEKVINSFWSVGNWVWVENCYAGFTSKISMVWLIMSIVNFVF